MDSGSIAWMLMASALVLFMTPGLAFFYGGLVRARNVINTIMYSFMAMAVVSVVWVLWGYSLAFGDGGGWADGRFIGDFSRLGLNGIDVQTGGDELIFVVFQMMFAIIPRADHRRDCGTVQVHHIPGFLGAVDHPGIRTNSPLGMGRQRLDL